MHFFKHLHTINKHHRIVRRICFKIGIPMQGIMHDLSKYSPTEFLNGIKYYQGTGSANHLERVNKGYSLSWMHHKGRNKHHFEYWYDIGKTNFYEPVKMPIKYVKEMFADRIAASKVYQGKKYNQGYPLEYLMKERCSKKSLDGNNNTIYMHEETFNLMYKLLEMLKEKGEKATFKYVKELKEY